MNKILILTTVFIIEFINIDASLSRTLGINCYKMFSLENVEHTVCLKFDDINDKIIVELDTAKLCLNGYRGIEEKINIINHKFLELSFKIRGGSGVALTRYVLICISNNNLYKSIDVLSMIRSDFIIQGVDSLKQCIERSINKLTFTLSIDKDRYKLIVIESEKVKSMCDISRDFETKEMFILTFDDKNKIFYNNFCRLEGTFNINADNDKYTVKKDFNGTECPVILLKGEEYYFINHSWYLKDGTNHLSEFSHSCY